MPKTRVRDESGSSVAMVKYRSRSVSVSKDSGMLELAAGRPSQSLGGAESAWA